MRLLSLILLYLGAMIGAGILALPYSFSISGLIFSILVFSISALISYTVSKILVEIEFLKKGVLEIPGIIGVYLGNKAKNFSIIIFLFSLYGAILSYYDLIFRAFNFLNVDANLALIFIFILSSFIVYIGKQSVESFNNFAMLIKFFILFSAIIFSIFYYHNINLNLLPQKFTFQILGISFFAFAAFSIVPNMKRFAKENEVKKAIKIATLLGFTIYFLFSLFVLPLENPLTFNEFFAISVIIIVLTPLILLSWVIKDVYIFDLEMKNYQLIYFLTIGFPFLFYFFTRVPFLSSIEFVGGIFISILYLMILYIGKIKKIISKNLYYVLSALVIIAILSVFLDLIIK